jgi:hypothetical protein
VVSVPVSVNIADLQIDIVEPRAGETFLAPANIRIGAAASVTGDTITQVDFLVDGVLAGSATTAPYTFNWTSSANGTHTVGAQARTASGLVAQARSASVTIAGAPAIAFDPGLDGMLVADDAAAIAGRIITQANSAVTVDGRRAALGPDGTFFLDGVPLAPGTNVLSVIVNSMDAPPAKATLTVHRSATQPFAVQLDPAEGLAPLDATLTIVNRGGVAFKRMEIDTNDDATPETTLTALTGNEARLTLKLAQPGVRTVRVTVFDADNKVIYVASRRVRVIDPTELGARVLGVHRTMVARLASGDVPGALRTFTGDAQARFQEIFTALGPDLPAAARQLGTFVDGVITETWAELTLARDTPAGRQAFMVYLIRGGDGVWRQETM